MESNIEELHLKVPLEEFVDDYKDKVKKLLDAEDVKFVGLSFYFLADGEILQTASMYSSGFDPNKFE